MRTLVVSDFHLGLGRRRVALEWPRPQAVFLDALEGVERLVLLGDVVELLGRPPERSLRVAEPVLRAVARRLGPRAEVIIVPGNHDHKLLAPWLRTRRPRLQADTPVPSDASPELSRLATWLGRDRVRVHYPGVWLTKSLWATHGHYLDRHLIPESSHGIGRGLLGRPPRDGASPAEYEASRGRSRVAALREALPPPLGWAVGQLASLARAATMPAAPAKLLSAQMAPLTAPLLSFQMQRASLPALARVAHRLGVEADLVVFGHVHRLGPLDGDDADEWRGPTGRMRLFNTGSWLYEPLLVHRASPPHPYWPGGAVIIEDGGDPQPVGLLDGLTAAELRHPRRR